MFCVIIAERLPQWFSRRWFLPAAGIVGTSLAMLPHQSFAISLPREIAVKEEIREKPKQLDCPIHYWHEVSSKDEFESYIFNLRSDGFYPINLSQIATYFKTGEKSWKEGEKPIAITFDDGLKSQYDNAVPILRRWKLQATFAVMPDWAGDGAHEYMTNAQIKELSNDWEIACHTYHHADLPYLRVINNPDWQAQIIRSKKRLEEIIGKKVTSFVYPYGHFDDQTIELVAKHYVIAARTGGKPTITANDLFIVPRQNRSQEV